MFVQPFNYHLANTYIGSMAQEHRMDVISNNLANVDTPGFKKDVPVFDGYLMKATAIHFGQGHLTQTDKKFDLALSGPGFFQVETADGIRLTRNGSFTTNSDGQLVTLDGNPVVGAGQIPENAVEVNILEDGRIIVDGQEQGQLEIVEFEDLRVLAKDGYNNFVPKVEGLEGQPAEETTVEQGFLEQSNAEPVVESVNLVDTVRTYEVFQKVIQSIQDADNKSINEVGRLT
ncbi:MAG: flagellar hook-basal body protein [Pseudomonadota bacterium]